MKVKAAEVLWSQSVQRHKMRYTTMVSDETPRPTQSSLKYNHMALMRIYSEAADIQQSHQTSQDSRGTEFNSGPFGLKTVKQSLGFREGEHGQRLGGARLKKRLYKSTLVEQKETKNRKKMTAASREKARLAKEAEEGGSSYQAGMF
ncbi:hypothetical protein RRG08_035285 [Elysia crispata]|uniref:Uncharacterized protein n=1 Tax=Elysia crispata TaxID=231223 RepID=A0AAE0ZWH6_9GAST|nr:hypothetical protein RRG08_035285 [Elysia crispata]